MKTLMVQVLKCWLWSMSPELVERVAVRRREQIFSIGIFEGPSPLRLEDPSDIVNPVLHARHVTDVRAAFVADPFMVAHAGRWYMFFEVYNCLLRMGHVGLATSSDGRAWRYQKIVLSERFHIAYPRVFAWRDRFWMIPDTPGTGIRLYCAHRFPDDWRLARVLMPEVDGRDPTIFQFQGLWWLLCGQPSAQTGVAMLRLFHASTPMGPWVEHRQSPLIENDPARARPGGSVVEADGRLYRFAQDGVPAYGSRVRAFEITQCSERTYAEREVDTGPVLTASSANWRRGGMHHIDAHQQTNGRWIACVDGWYPT